MRQQTGHGIGQFSWLQLVMQLLECIQRLWPQGRDRFGGARRRMQDGREACLDLYADLADLPSACLQLLCKRRGHLSELGRMCRAGYGQDQLLCIDAGNADVGTEAGGQQLCQCLFEPQVILRHCHDIGGALVVAQPAGDGMAGRTGRESAGNTTGHGYSQYEQSAGQAGMKIAMRISRSGRAGRWKLSGMPLVLVMALALLASAAAGALLQRHYDKPVQVGTGLRFQATEDLGRDASFVRENVNLLAARVGVLEAQLLNIDAMSQRVARMADIPYVKADDLTAAPLSEGQIMDEPPMDWEHAGTGDGLDAIDGMATSNGAERSAQSLGRELDSLVERLDVHKDRLALFEAALAYREADRVRLPTTMPVKNYPYLSSSYGWRRNPVTGRYAMHEGLDFSAPRETPIVAAASGMVIEAEFSSGYGNMVVIDHGHGLITRYAHASKLLVKPGDLIERGQEIAKVGSTGRSTGPHLHFEVRMAGQPLDPKLFLAAADSPVKMADAIGMVTPEAAALN